MTATAIEALTCLLHIPALTTTEQAKKMKRFFIFEFDSRGNIKIKSNGGSVQPVPTRLKSSSVLTIE